MIKATNLTRDYGAFRAVNDISFSVEKGEVLGFLGPNGAGKSTTMKMLVGFLAPTSGSASINDHDIQKEPIEAKRQVGYLPENGPLYQEMTVIELLEFAAKIRELPGKAVKGSVQRVMDICHLNEVKYQSIETLSKGYRQRVGMAQAVIHDPPCLILDEPTDGLDPNQKREMRQFIAKIAAEKAIILSTHILEEVESICNRVLIIDHGAVIADETPESLIKRHPLYNALRVCVDTFDLDTIRTDLEALEKVQHVEKQAENFLVIPQAKENIREAVWQLASQKQWTIKAIEPDPTHLDAVFASLTQKDSSVDKE